MILCFFLGGAEAACEPVAVSGPPEWLASAAQEALSAVWQEMSPRYSVEQKAEMLSLVAGRLFEGYEVSSVEVQAGGAHLFLTPKAASDWRVRIVRPQMSQSLLSWFEEDVKGVDSSVLTLLEGVPVEALRWGDRALHEEVARLLEERLPGWEPHLLVKAEEKAVSLEVSFSPSPPLVLFVEPRIFSRSLPVFLVSGLREDVIETLSPIVGMPLEWVSLHAGEVEAWAKKSLEEERIISEARGVADVRFKPERLSRLEAEVESSRYAVWVWAAAYAGTDDRYPEVGLHLGRKAQPFSGWDAELYGEWVLEANDADLESRWGLRWSPWLRIWLGYEVAYPGEEGWARLWLEGGVKKPYFWWRRNDDGQDNWGLGYRITEHIAIELHYDERDDDSLSLRALGNL